MDTIITRDPQIDATKGTFNGPQRPANSLSAGFVSSVFTQVLKGAASFNLTLDSIQGGVGDLSGCCGGVAAGTTTTYWLTASAAGLPPVTVAMPVVLNGNDGTTTGVNGFFPALNTDAAASAPFGGDGTFPLKGGAFDTLPSFGYTTGQTLGCRLGPSSGYAQPGDSTCM